MKKYKVLNVCLFPLIILAVAFLISINDIANAQTATTSPTPTTLSPKAQLFKVITDGLGVNRDIDTLFVVTALSFGQPAAQILQDISVWKAKRDLNKAIKDGEVLIVNANGNTIFNVTKYFNSSKTKVDFPNPGNVLNQIRVIAKVSSNTNAKSGNVIIKEVF